MEKEWGKNFEKNFKEISEKIEEIEKKGGPQNFIRIIDKNDPNERYKALRIGEAKKRTNPEIDIEKFLFFHRKRIVLLKKLLDKKTDEKLIFQISFLGIESLAKLSYPEETDSGKRFISLLSKTIKEDEAIHLYKFWRCPLVHEGFIIKPWTTLEAWDDGGGFVSFPDGLKSSTEYPAGSIMAIYENLIDYLDEYFKKQGIKSVELLS